MSVNYVTVTYDEGEVREMLANAKIEGMPRIDVEASMIALRTITLRRLKEALPGVGPIVYFDTDPSRHIEVQSDTFAESLEPGRIAREIRTELLSDPKNFALPDVRIPVTGRDIF